ncbi:unnamed protein product [Effrenium voratum]|nr:unnamed protein product [Effrenium voratum]
MARAQGALRSRFTEFDAVSGFVTPVVLLARASAPAERPAPAAKLVRCGGVLSSEASALLADLLLAPHLGVAKPSKADALCTAGGDGPLWSRLRRGLLLLSLGGLDNGQRTALLRGTCNGCCNPRAESSSLRMWLAGRQTSHASKVLSRNIGP